jgi:hypothetical protein
VVFGSDTLGFVLGRAPFEPVFPFSLTVVPLFIMMERVRGLRRPVEEPVRADTRTRPRGCLRRWRPEGLTMKI